MATVFYRGIMVTIIRFLSLQADNTLFSHVQLLLIL